MGWIDIADRLPTSADGDAWQCVLAWHRYNGAMVIGWHQVGQNSYITHWQPCPKAPEGRS